MRKNITSAASRFWQHVDKTEFHWIWTGYRNKGGYGMIKEYFNGKPSRPVLAHRLSWEIANGPIPDGFLVLHRNKCNLAFCIRPDHLYLGTHKENSNDTAEAGHYRLQKDHPIGSKHPATNLTEEDVLCIRKKRSEGTKIRAIAEEYGLGISCLKAIVSRQNWRHI
jgi:hypothetical protein